MWLGFVLLGDDGGVMWLEFVLLRDDGGVMCPGLLLLEDDGASTGLGVVAESLSTELLHWPTSGRLNILNTFRIFLP